MNLPPRSLARARCAAAFLFAAGVLGSPAPLGASEPARIGPLPFEIGKASRIGAAFTITASQPASSQLTGQMVRLQVIETTGVQRTTHYFTLATGKTKTVAQLDAVLGQIFHHFLELTTVTPGKDLGKVGDLQHGSEVHFVVGSKDDLQFANFSPNAPVRTSHYTRSDVELLLAALPGVPPT